MSHSVYKEYQQVYCCVVVELCNGVDLSYVLSSCCCCCAGSFRQPSITQYIIVHNSNLRINIIGVQNCPNCVCLLT